MQETQCHSREPWGCCRCGSSNCMELDKDCLYCGHRYCPCCSSDFWGVEGTDSRMTFSDVKPDAFTIQYTTTQKGPRQSRIIWCCCRCGANNFDVVLDEICFYCRHRNCPRCFCLLPRAEVGHGEESKIGNEEV